MLGWLPVQCYIDKCKLQFFGRVCRMDNCLLPKQILLLRLLEFKNKCVQKQCGFVPDLMKIINEYNLSDFVNNFLTTGLFPSKTVWNCCITNAIKNTEERRWRHRMSNDSDFNFFSLIHKNIAPHKAWTVARSFPKLRTAAKYVIDLCAIVRTEENALLCDKCGMFFTNIIVHILCSCDRVLSLREQLWERVIAIDPIEFSVYLDSLSQDTFAAVILSCDAEYELEEEDRIYFSQICTEYVYRMCTAFYNC